MQHMIKRMNKTGTAIVVDSRIATVMEIRGCSAIRKAQQATKRVTHGWSTLIAVIMGCPLTHDIHRYSRISWVSVKNTNEYSS